nr:PilW family protein [uncultured Amphritea sp.]
MIELMIAMVIGLILTAAVLQVFVGSKATYSTQTGLARLQENGRFALEYLSRDVRLVGFMGCSNNNTIASVVNDDGSDVIDFIDFSSMLEGEDNVAGTESYGGVTPLAGSDVMTVKYADQGGSCTIESHDAAGDKLVCDTSHDFQKGDVLVVSDCSQTVTLQQTNTNSSTESSVEYVSGSAGVSPGNNAVTLSSFSPGASVFKLQAYRYFVAQNSFGEPSLYRQGITNNSGKLEFASAVELVEGVEGMQILYGEDIGSDERADRYVAAGAVSDFDNVVAVRVNLLIQSNEENIVKGDQTLTYNGSSVTYNDGRLRKVFSSTIALRNRL